MISTILILSTALAVLANAQNQTSNCAEKWDAAFECVEKIKVSADARTLDKKRDDITKKCVPNLPPQCTAVKKAGDQCQERIFKDAALVALRIQIRENVSKCFERFPADSRRPPDSPLNGGFQPPPAFDEGRGPPPPPIAPFSQGQDPCAPTESQSRCIRTEMRNETQAQDIAEKLENQQLDCYKEVNNDACRIDGNPQLRNCVEIAKQPFMQQAVFVMQECMQAALNSSMPTI